MKNRHQFIHQTSAFGKSLPSVRVAGVLVSALLALLAGAAGQVLAADFYVGGNGASDRNPGTASEPFATIQKAADVAQPGAVVKIRDGIYRETVVPANKGKEENPIMFEADAGAEPVISGADLVTTNWQLANHANLNPAYPIYETTVNLPPVEYISHNPAVTGNEVLMAQQIFVRSKMMQEARWPKIPYADFDHPMKGNNHARVLRFEDEDGPWAASVSGNNLVIRDDGLPNIPGGLAGAHCQVLCWYVPSCAAVLSSSGKEFVVDGDMPGANNNMRMRLAKLRDLWAYKDRHKEQFRYWIRGALGLLTSEGEFYYDESQNKLYLWAPGGGLPENIEYKARNWGFDLTGKSHIHLNRLNFFACDIPTNGESLWPSNAKNWDAIQPVPAQYTQTAKPTYPTVQAKADAERFIAGAHPSDRNNPAAVPQPANGILIDYCRFKYLNHQTFMVAMPGGSPPALEFSETGLQQGNSNTNFGNMHRCGVRLTGDHCIVRNSVFDTASGSHLMVTGKNCRIENNYFKDANYIGNWSSSIGAGVVATGLKVYGNTFWRSGRTHLWNLQDHVEVSFNDWSEWSYLNVDGGGTYSHSRHRNNRNHGARWNEGMYRTYFGYNLLGRKERPADADQHDSYGLEGSVWHHNWCHDSRTFNAAHEASGGIYFDGSSDGAVVHHNVLWNCRAIDFRAPNTYSDSRFDYENTPLGVNWLYNNTFGTPDNDKDGVSKGVDRNNLTVMHYGDHPHAMHNNIYRANATPGFVVPYTLNSTEIQLNSGSADHMWFDHKGAYASTPANGKPWLIGFGPGQYPSGLGLFPKAGSPAIDRGILVSALRYSNSDVNAELRGKLLTDAIGRPLDYVDVPVNHTSPDAGAYEFGGPQVPGAPKYYNNSGHPAHGAWIPGTTLPREFIEGQPWERQWAAQ